jgi:hypothetical protein
VNDTGPKSQPEIAPQYATLAAFNIAFITMVGSSALAMSLAVLAPMLMAAAEMSAAAFGWISGAVGLGSVWL